MIKPVSEGSSLGMSQALTAAELQQAFELASQFDTDVIAEQWIAGPEYTVSVVQGEVMPVIQMQTADQFYTYEAKYLSAETTFLCPAPISEKQTEELQQISLKAFNALGCSGWGRVDLMQAENGDFLLLEANTIPGLTSHSLVPMSAAAMGITFAQLILLILDSARLNR
jgi:D-alanine-D-alanine ligase